MDLWIVAAATGAGYIAKSLQNLSADKNDSLGEQTSYNVRSVSKNFLHQLRNQTCPLRRLARERAENESSMDMTCHTDVDFSEIDDGLSNKELDVSVSSRSGDESFPSMIINAEEDLEFDCEFGNFTELQRGYSIISRRASMRSIKPLRSLRSRLDARTFKDHENTVENRILNRYVLKGLNKERWVKDFGLRNIGAMLRSSSSFEPVEQLQNKLKECSENSDAKVAGDSVSGADAMFLFITGMTIGILFATRTWKTKTDHISKQLDQMEILVQDTQDELDMTEKLMLEELSIDNSPQLQKNDSSSSSTVYPTEEKMQIHVETLDDDVLDPNVNVSENIELLSKIEGELQFELELLEQNIKVSSDLERLSDVVEIDPDLEIEVALGDLKIGKEIRDCSYESENEATHTVTVSPKQVNYAVSPCELTLRLHELKESRLQERIEELERALYSNTEIRAQVLNSQNNISGRIFYYNEMESPYTQHLTHGLLGGTRILSSTLSFGRNYYPQVYEPSSYNGPLVTVKDTNREERNGESSRKDIDRKKPFIRPKI